MKKILGFILAIVFCTGCGVSNAVMKNDMIVEEVQLYCVDSDLYKLIPYDKQIEAVSAQDAAEKIIKELVEGMQYEKIKHLIPVVKDGVTVRVDGDIAYVNLSAEMIRQHPDGIDAEFLTVYSIVNSLASLDAVSAVRFTIDGKEEKVFKGFLDMRETFVPDYMV